LVALPNYSPEWLAGCTPNDAFLSIEPCPAFLPMRDFRQSCHSCAHFGADFIGRAIAQARRDAPRVGRILPRDR
jgi:hypothetical protein